MTLITDIELPMTSATAGAYQTFKLSDFRGKNVVLYLHPKDSTPGCTTESMAFACHEFYQSQQRGFWHLARHTLKSHDKFKTNLELPFELISDADELLCQQFDVIKQKMMYGKQVRGIERSTFIINTQGELVHEWRKVKVDNHVADVLATVQALTHA